MPMAKSGYVYILASKRNGTLYVGVTSDLVQRIHRHRATDAGGFTTRYGVKRLVHFEVFDDIASAIAREKALKKWRRIWKLDLIERNNPG
jgi:putative endonuclease